METNANSIYVFATWNVKEGNLETVLSILKEVGEKSRKEEGNLFYKVRQSITDKNTLMLFEGYADEVAVNAHRNTQHYQELVVGKLIPLLEKREVVLTKALCD